jgi:hypothetical protein
MGRVVGDKSRYNKHRRKKLAKRVRMRALRKELLEPSATAAPASR